MTDPSRTFYDAVGGTDTFRRLVDAFYDRVHDDPVLLPLYPPDELAAAPDRLRMFLEQYWGGPKTYGEQRGHPRLRMRHVVFRIGETERDAWLAAMRSAMDTLDLLPAQDAELWVYLQTAAHSLVNTTTGEEAGPVAPSLTTEPGADQLITEIVERPEPGQAR